MIIIDEKNARKTTYSGKGNVMALMGDDLKPRSIPAYPALVMDDRADRAIALYLRSIVEICFYPGADPVVIDMAAHQLATRAAAYLRGD